jgi:uncharacterized sulfatase
MPPGYRQEGKDFSPLLRGEKVPWRDAVFGQYDLHNSGLAYMRSVRTARYHLVRFHYANFLDELYDLEKDPGELRNVFGNAKYREVRDQLRQRLTEWQRAIDDPVLRAAGK